MSKKSPSVTESHPVSSWQTESYDVGGGDGETDFTEWELRYYVAKEFIPKPGSLSESLRKLFFF